ncbi:MAG: hypothetical protein H0X30_08100 [Anaerolineae bacterium]|nr:hypothetical protein [Anaerolineae bacterium]
MNSRKFIVVIAVFTLLTALVFTAQAADAPSVAIGDQLVLGGFVTVDSIYSEGPGFVVIHRASDGGVVGVSQPLNAGWTYDLRINLDTTKAEAKMSAMLHVDDGAVGTYEFGTVDGKDLPVKNGADIVNTLFNAQVLDATDQKVVDGSVTIKAVAMPADGFVVVHGGDKDKFGGVLGETFVKAGSATDVKVALTGDLTSVLWPMLHIDNGVAGKYEFTGTEIDAPIVLNGEVASFPIWTVPHLRVWDQATIHGDNMPPMTSMMDMAMVHIKSVLSDGPGIVVVHANENGNAGAILGAAFVKDGLTQNIDVMVDTTAIGPVVWPMLHIDAGTVGKYDGLDVDKVVSADGEAVTFTINDAPSLTVLDQKIADDGTITIHKAIMDAPGWIAIHADNAGAPGEVIATAFVHAGANWDVKIKVDPAKAGTKVFPMLHYDTAALGTYEFGTVKDADAPVFVQKNVVVLPLNITK